MKDELKNQRHLLILIESLVGNKDTVVHFVKTNFPNKFFVENKDVYLQMKKTVAKKNQLVKTINDIIRTNDYFENVIIAVGKGRFRFGNVDDLLDILHKNDHHAFVFARTNNSGLKFLPSMPCDLNQNECENLKNKMCENFHSYNVVPYPQVSCIVIKNKNFSNFCYFDELFEDIQNAVVDIAFRWSSYGFSSVVANHVFFEMNLNSESCIKIKTDLFEKKYEEFFLSQKNYIESSRDPVNFFFNEIIVGNTRKKILFYLIPVQPIYNGTSEYVFAVLNSFVKQFSKKYDISIVLSKRTAIFFQNDIPHDVSVHYEENISYMGGYDLVFMPVQHFSETNLPRILSLAPKNILMIHDVIALRCLYLSQCGASLNLNALAIEMADGVLSNSASSLQDIKDFFNLDDRKDLKMEYTHLSVDFQFKTEQDNAKKYENLDFFNEKYILIFGNSFKHKALREAVSALKSVDVTKVVFGDRGYGMGVNKMDKFIFLPSGSISEKTVQKIYDNAHLYVYPSQYEGFGLPVLRAIQKQKKIIVYRSSVNEELQKTFVKNDMQVIYFDNFSQLAHIVYENMDQYHLNESSFITWDGTTVKIEKFFAEILESPVDVLALRKKWFIARLWQNKEIAEYEISIHMLKDLIYRYFRRKWKRYAQNILRIVSKK